ncbi:hypothetical protein KDL29_12475 [bacterium]|nr:hypothetical protein [bacterium]
MRRTAEGGWTRVLALILAVLALQLCASCGGGGKSEGGSQNQEQRTVLELSLNSVSQPNGTIHVELSATNAASLYQLSSRLSFDSAAVRPLGPAVPGNLPAQDAIFYSNDRQSGYIPVAFTNTKAAAVGQQSGILYSVEFEVLDAGLDPRFALVTDPQYLIARDNSASDIKLSVEVQR